MARLNVLKTYKIYIGGQFPRTESGRYYELLNKKGETIANVCLSSRKDFRNAVVAARSAFAGWSGKSAFNRSQILYRIAEMLEGRKSQFVEELVLQGLTKVAADKEVLQSIDRLVHYAGWCDKYSALFSSVNPVASSHFNFSVPEPTGVVSVIAPENSGLLGLVSVIAPIICGGNTCVVLASNSLPLSSITLAEVLATSDLPGGVVNILTGTSKELHSHFSSHMDVNAVIYCRENKEEAKIISENASLNVKRSFNWNKDWNKEENQNPYLILDLQEIKTTWHPIENIGIGGAKY
ncbi:aldehyde dehydrogenase family protein [Sediminibacterium sp.]|uniref:aldehyde dehydrogenase family protein n=1 Tax=Sediminibacterium sp. TaxID=1917865 RepID=UPI002734523E|nr:aldehyde dehydrogenase family protein [Sediminibacterium sp.]MDP3567336.1 aldehyde dehydrogenase family protein [Sediminibacterium sp.]